MSIAVVVAILVLAACLIKSALPYDGQFDDKRPVAARPPLPSRPAFETPPIGVVHKGRPEDIYRGRLLLSEAWVEDTVLRIRGRVDQAYANPVGKVVIVDTKGGAARNIPAKEVAQLSLYRHLVAKKLGVAGSDMANYGYIRFSDGCQEAFVRVHLMDVDPATLARIADGVRHKKRGVANA